jgi:hypothetical protein
MGGVLGGSISAETGAISDLRRRLPRSRLDADLQYLPERLIGIVLYLGLERKNSDDARHPLYRSNHKAHHMGGTP